LARSKPAGQSATQVFLFCLAARDEYSIEPGVAGQAKIARQAYRDFGKGSGHPAGLNFGDCFSYALARDKREPMLWKGDHFGHTGIRPA